MPSPSTPISKQLETSWNQFKAQLEKIAEIHGEKVVGKLLQNLGSNFPASADDFASALQLAIGTPSRRSVAQNDAVDLRGHRMPRRPGSPGRID